MKPYNTILKPIRAEFIEKKSRFITNIFPVESEMEAKEVLESIRGKYSDANHNCFAYVIRNYQGVLEGFSDNGEPPGTAGKPILSVINGSELKNVIIIVTRYFGGALLGTGGLVRAYQKGAKSAVNESQIITRIFGHKVKIRVDYGDLKKVEYTLGQNGIKVLNSNYTDIVEIYVGITPEEFILVNDFVNEITNGKGTITKEGELWLVKKVGG